MSSTESETAAVAHLVNLRFQTFLSGASIFFIQEYVRFEQVLNFTVGHTRASGGLFRDFQGQNGTFDDLKRWVWGVVGIATSCLIS
jgi:hypothetical protein